MTQRIPDGRDMARLCAELTGLTRRITAAITPTDTAAVDEDDDAPTMCTCADAGDCFAPVGHYKDCPQATPPATDTPAARPACVPDHATTNHCPGCTWDRDHPADSPAGSGIRGLLEHVGIDTRSRDITVDGHVVDPAPAAGEDEQRTARRASAAVLHARAVHGALTPTEGEKLRQHYNTEARDVDRLERNYATVADWYNAAIERAEQAEAELKREQAAVERVRERCQGVRDRCGPGGMINASQILGLLSPTWPDGNYEAPALDGTEQPTGEQQ